MCSHVTRLDYHTTMDAHVFLDVTHDYECRCHTQEYIEEYNIYS